MNKKKETFITNLLMILLVVSTFATVCNSLKLNKTLREYNSRISEYSKILREHNAKISKYNKKLESLSEETIKNIDCNNY